MTPAGVRARVLEGGFDDPWLVPGRWDGLLGSGASDVVFLTAHWQRCWWESFGRGDLMLIAAERDGRETAVGPLFHVDGTAYLVGCTFDSDYLDIVGAVDGEILEAIVSVAFDRVRTLRGLRLYHVPASSPTTSCLEEVAARLGLRCVAEDHEPAPALDLGPGGEAGLTASRKRSLLRHERLFARSGALCVRHIDDGPSMAPHLDAFFDQHIARWSAVDQPYPSVFLDPAYRRFYRRLTASAPPGSGLRFTRVDWDGRPIAFHFGSCHAGRYLWYKPTFAIELAHRSPGEVLLRQLLLAAVAEGAHSFDFGLGDEAFKLRFATRVDSVRTWGLYR